MGEVTHSPVGDGQGGLGPGRLHAGGMVVWESVVRSKSSRWDAGLCIDWVCRVERWMSLYLELGRDSCRGPAGIDWERPPRSVDSWSKAFGVPSITNGTETPLEIARSKFTDDGRRRPSRTIGSGISRSSMAVPSSASLRDKTGVIGVEALAPPELTLENARNSNPTWV